jgi:hypothetical protein
MKRRTWNLRRVSFGSTAAIVASMGLVVGLDAATVTKDAIVGSLLLVAVADNLTDSLSVHIYQESERLAEREAFRSTVANFLARFLVCVTFILILVLLPTSQATQACVIWGFVLLSGLSYLLARARAVSAFSEIWKHAAVAFVVILLSKAIGAWILTIVR